MLFAHLQQAVIITVINVIIKATTTVINIIRNDQ